MNVPPALIDTVPRIFNAIAPAAVAMPVKIVDAAAVEENILNESVEGTDEKAELYLSCAR
jgi:hypothetical protein